MLSWNKAFRLATPSHVTSLNQSEYIFLTNQSVLLFHHSTLLKHLSMTLAQEIVFSHLEK